MTEVFIPLLVLLVIIYWMWRTHVATNERIALLKDVDNFLNPEKHNSDLTMSIVYNAYRDSKKHFFVIEFVLFTLLKSRRADVKQSMHQSAEEYKRLPKSERKKMAEIVGKLLITNLKGPVNQIV
jgi:hypothetical protein